MRQQRLHLAREERIRARGRIGNERAITTATVAVDVALDERRERESRLGSGKECDGAGCRGAEPTREDHDMTGIVEPRRPLHAARIAECGAVESAELAARALQGV